MRLAHFGEVLGTGATFVVSLARWDSPSASLDGYFVLKRPAPRLRHLAQGELALDREWDALHALALGSLPRPLFRGRDEEGPYLAETLAPGISFRQWQERAGGPLGLDTFRPIALASSSALAELHAHRDGRGPLGFVHGDISPDNLFFDEGGRSTFIDLATSHWRDAAPVFPKARGTLPYAAPELARGEAPSSASTDTYALAAVLAMLLVPQLVESRAEAALLVEVAERGLRIDGLAERSDIPLRALDALRDALSFAPEHRLASSRELASELAAAFAA